MYGSWKRHVKAKRKQLVGINCAQTPLADWSLIKPNSQQQIACVKNFSETCVDIIWVTTLRNSF